MALASLQAGFRELVRSPAKPPRIGGGGVGAADRSVLERIPAERVQVYHDLLVGGHRAFATYIYGSTVQLLAAIERAHPDLAKGTGPRELVEAFIAKDFAATHSLRDLADRLGAFFRKRYARAFREVPLLADLLRFERLKLDVDLVEDGPGTPATEARLQALATLTLDGLLRTRVLVPTHLRMLRARHDLGLAVAKLLGEREAAVLAAVVRPMAADMVIMRHPVTLLPASQVLDASVLKDLGRFEPGRPFPAEELAAKRHRRGPRGEAEEQALQRIVAELFGWLRSGILFLAPEPTPRKVRRRSPRPASRSRSRSGR